MSKQDNLTDFLTDVADAIRTKTGTSGTINPQNFTQAIIDIPTNNGCDSANGLGSGYSGNDITVISFACPFNPMYIMGTYYRSSSGSNTTTGVSGSILGFYIEHYEQISISRTYEYYYWTNVRDTNAIYTSTSGQRSTTANSTKLSVYWDGTNVIITFPTNFLPIKNSNSRFKVVAYQYITSQLGPGRW